MLPGIPDDDGEIQKNAGRSSESEAPLRPPLPDSFTFAAKAATAAAAPQHAGDLPQDTLKAWSDCGDKPTPLTRADRTSSRVREALKVLDEVSNIRNLFRSKTQKETKLAEEYEERLLLASGTVGTRGLENRKLGRMEDQSASKRMVHKILASWVFDAVMGIVIAANSITIGVQAHVSNLELPSPLIVDVLENAFLGVYTAEVLLRFYAYGFVALQGNWVRFDSIIVACGLFELCLLPFQSNEKEDEDGILGPIMVIRMLRLIRLARLVRLCVHFKTLWFLVSGLIHSIGTLLWTALTMGLVMYVFSIAGMELIRPQPEYGADYEKAASNFASMGLAMLTLLQFLTLDSVSEIYRPLVMANPFLIVYFAAYILCSSIALVNLVTAIMVDSSMKQTAADKEGQRAWANAKKKKMLPKLQGMFREIDAHGRGSLTMADLEEAPKELIEQLSQAADAEGVKAIFEAIDLDGGGTVDIDEFCDGIMRAQSDKPIELIRIMHQCSLCTKNNKQTFELHDKFTDDLEEVKAQQERLEVRLHNIETYVGRLAAVARSTGAGVGRS
eukprot:TRINITY_DN14858_c1_g2_i1.p1 TRINITY_DN14858_c1_g2~~TRINITY_DN14858_c1_g2_i1.p1  ORF type:complete len:558 (+),score=127.05 TRINITY_DN14858_c1_g2_i1:42-1715(+)